MKGRVPFTDLRRHWRPTLAVHAFVRLAVAAVALPLLTWAFRALLAASGDRVISNFDIAAFLLSPAGAGLALAAAALTVAFSLVEMAGLTQVAAAAVAGERPGFGGAIAFIARRFPTLIRLAVRMLARIAVLLLPVAGAAAFAWFGMLGEHDINYYLAEKPPEWQRSVWIVGTAAAVSGLLVAWQLARWLYALPILAARPEAGAPEALAESMRLTRGKLPSILPPVLGWWAAIGGVALVGAWAGAAISGAAFDWAGMDVRRVLPVVAVGLAVAFLFELVLSGAGLAGQQFILVRRFAAATGSQRAAKSQRGPAAAPARVVARAVAAVVVAAAIAATVAWLAVADTDLRTRVEVTAHRGASAAAPENTMAAFRAALDAGTDWIELDVQRLADGEVVVVHDGDFLRVGGDARRVGAVSAADLPGIGFGARYGVAYAGEHPPLLADVIALVRGRARLNIELKYNVPDAQLAPAVLAIVARESFLDQCVFSSLDYAALRQVKRLEPRAVTGHIVTAAVGNVVRTEADFLSLNAAQASTALVRRAHRAGKRVHVWTVNTRDGMLELAARGVDNIITDDPALFARVKAEAAALDPPELLGLRLRALFGRAPEELEDPSRVTLQ